MSPATAAPPRQDPRGPAPPPRPGPSLGPCRADGEEPGHDPFRKARCDRRPYKVAGPADHQDDEPDQPPGPKHLRQGKQRQLVPRRGPTSATRAEAKSTSPAASTTSGGPPPSPAIAAMRPSPTRRPREPEPEQEARQPANEPRPARRFADDDLIKPAAHQDEQPRRRSPARPRPWRNRPARAVAPGEPSRRTRRRPR